MAKLVSFLTENENLIKQPQDATSSSDYDPDFSPSPRPQAYGLRPSRGSITSTLISPLTRNKFFPLCSTKGTAQRNSSSTKILVQYCMAEVPNAVDKLGVRERDVDNDGNTKYME
ncbi:hypothetical protein AVEN_212730-1 [Araneus ventricosus]|uniref:Uncharacterized protein n=1 Tax=Araneus ventricosus TaxID=182803 RepID=A0A4Y2LYD7_ARAVE|nr:hypothetical protein AVEN_13075-1 [Araneus ventricosus]GBN19832.1 hypothetical protein AVEN_212730-1 [Araneus ventricosus]